LLRNTRISSREKVEPFVTVECAKCNSKGQDAIAPFRNFEIAVSYWETRRADCMGSNRFAFFVIERLLQLWRRSVLRDIHHDADVADHEVDDPSLLWASSELPELPAPKTISRHVIQLSLIHVIVLLLRNFIEIATWPGTCITHILIISCNAQLYVFYNIRIYI